MVNSLEEALQLVDVKEKAFIIGGGEIYRQALPFCQRIHYTEVDVVIEDATVFFPEIKTEEWSLRGRVECEADEKNPHNYSFNTYDRIEDVGLI